MAYAIKPKNSSSAFMRSGTPKRVVIDITVVLKDLLVSDSK
jgi:hypothetical protein